MKIDPRCSYTRLARVSELKPNPKNPNVHPKSQIELLAKMIQHQGWRSPIVVSNQSGLIVVGHGRYEAAKLLNLDVAPVDEQDFNSKSDELAHMVADNRITELADTDTDLTKEIALELDSNGFELEVAGLTSDLLDVTLGKSNYNDNRELPEKSIGGSGNPLWLKNDVRFESSNRLGIPDLLPEMIIEVPRGLVTHTKRDTESKHRLVTFKNDPLGNCDPTTSVLCFYVFDAQFESFVDSPAHYVEKFLASKWLAIVTPNISIYPQMPLVQQQWLTFKARWVGRYLQSVGIKVIPDIEWSDYESLEFVLLGVPKYSKSVSVQLQTALANKREVKQREKGLQLIASRVQPRSVLVYGAEPYWQKQVVDIFKKSRIVFCKSFHTMVTKYLLRNKKKKGGEKDAQTN